MANPEPVILDGGTKMRRLREALPRVSPLDFAVLFVLFEEADRKTGVATIAVADLAAAVRHKERAIERSTARLVDLHLLSIARGRGRGHVNEYRLLPERASSGTPFEETKGRLPGHEKASLDDTKRRLPGHDTLFPLNTLESLPPVDRADTDKRRSLGRCWLAIKERLARPERYGPDYVAAWFKGTQVEGITDGVVTLVEGTRFLANSNQRDRADVLLREWQTIDARIKAVRFTHEAPLRAGPITEPTERQNVVDLREELKAAGAVRRASPS